MLSRTLRHSRTLALVTMAFDLLLRSGSAQAAAPPATATTKATRLDDGSNRIEIQVNPGGTMVKDVHLCVGRTSVSGDDDEAENTRQGDPMKSHWRAWPLPAGQAPPAGVPNAAGIPAGWGYRGLLRRTTGNVSVWCHTWTNPANGLGGQATFTVDYLGGMGNLTKETKENLFLTSNGANTFKKTDIVNGQNGKGEKGHMPPPAFPPQVSPAPP